MPIIHNIFIGAASEGFILPHRHCPLIKFHTLDSCFFTICPSCRLIWKKERKNSLSWMNFKCKYEYLTSCCCRSYVIDADWPSTWTDGLTTTILATELIYFALSNFDDFLSDIWQYRRPEIDVDRFHWLAAVNDCQAAVLFPRKVIHHRHCRFSERHESLPCCFRIVVVPTWVLTYSK